MGGSMRDLSLASIALRETDAHEPPFHTKAVVLEEEFEVLLNIILQPKSLK